jgi:hypothetical protein
MMDGGHGDCSWFKNSAPIEREWSIGGAGILRVSPDRRLVAFSCRASRYEIRVYRACIAKAILSQRVRTSL